MNVGLNPALKHGFHGRAEARDVKRPDAVREHGCIGSKRNPASGLKLEDLTQALAQAVVVKLKQSLSVNISAAPKPAGLNPSEQARGEIANALGTALHTPTDGGSVPPASDVRAIAEAALQDSAKELQQVGASANALSDAVNALTTHLSSLFDAFASMPESEGDSIAAAATSARLVTREKGVLELRTREGDVVRISFGTRVDVKAQGALATDGTASFSALDVTAKVRSASEISVKGDLNEQELAAIADLVVKVDALANEFFAGNVDEAFAAAAALDLGDGPLADLALKLSMSQRYTESNVMARQPLPTSASEAVDAQSPAQPAATPVVDGTAEQPSPEPVVTSTETSPTDTPEAPSDEPSATQSIQQVIAKFMARSWMTFQSDDTARLGVSIKMKFELLVAAIEAASPAETPVSEGVAKLADVAGALAEKGSNSTSDTQPSPAMPA